MCQWQAGGLPVTAVFMPSTGGALPICYSVTGMVRARVAMAEPLG